MEILKKIMINTIALFIAWGLLVWGAYAIWTLNKNFTSGSQLQAKDLQDMVNKINEVTSKLNQVEGTANSARNVANTATNIAKIGVNELAKTCPRIHTESWCSRCTGRKITEYERREYYWTGTTCTYRVTWRWSEYEDK